MDCFFSAISKDKFFINISFSSKCFRLGIIVADSISKPVIVCDDKSRYSIIKHCIGFEKIKQLLSLWSIFRGELFVRDRKVYEKLVSIRSLSYYEMSKKSLMSHLVISGES